MTLGIYKVGQNIHVIESNFVSHLTEDEIETDHEVKMNAILGIILVHLP